MVSVRDGSVVAGYPVPLSHIRMHPNGRMWCGAFGREIYILRLEGPGG